MNETKIRIKELLKERGLSYQDFADMAHTTKAHISNVANGKSQPSIEILERWSKVLDIPLEEMFEKGAGKLVCPHCGKPIFVVIEKG